VRFPDRLPHAWDIKALDKLIVLSAAYRQSAKASTGNYQADPENRLISRGPRFRLSAETLRDQALAVSGLLVPDIGGPSVRPYMPEGVWDETSRYGDLRGYRPDEGSGLYSSQLVHHLETHGSSAIDAALRRSQPRNLYRETIAYKYSSTGTCVTERDHMGGSCTKAGRTQSDQRH
jgi:hypothetical protein